MNLQSDRVAALCEELKLAGVVESFAALATAAVETEQSSARSSNSPRSTLSPGARTWFSSAPPSPIHSAHLATPL